jgi:putative hydrolase of the HAD superfamily
MTIEVIGLDGDDTLWRNEEYFAISQELFRSIVEPFAPDDVDVDAELSAAERRNLELFGYGIKGFTLSMIESAIEITGGCIPTKCLQVLLDRGKEMLAHPVELLDGVAETVAELADHHRLVLVTKGDLIHQEQKVARSGIADRFAHVEIVAEKDVPTYARILHRHGIDPRSFVMAGNSVKSDILPVLAVGARAVHIPYELTWVHEHAEHDGSVPTLTSIRELPAWVEANG